MKELRERFWLALHVLRGRPLAYRMRFNGTVHFGPNPGSIVAECIFTTATGDATTKTRNNNANGVILEDRL